MFDLIPPAHGELQDFLQFHSEALQSASLLLGGKPAVKATSALIDDISSAPVLTRRLQQSLVRLHELLSLEHVHDFNRPESAYFADFDPAAPYVEDLCLLAEAFQDILFRISDRLDLPRAA
ncbi:hypothetical protein KL867_02565 [Ruegeria litorea]|uniref:Uncharacterized protein n=1 Tax=Falsiruegeria litorea TaxID=1280831 RepID=A0ABS5WLM4_9RHOB|nr:hypothetical protein [Falsiruegeria litorea]MBT3139922.1 hypothetical protein [Falsiruegeria litorea]